MEALTEPPTYAASATPRRSIQDLRAQIIANGSVMRLRRFNDAQPADDHIELIACVAPTHTSRQQAARTTHFSEKQSVVIKKDGSQTFAMNSRPNTGASSSTSSSEAKHYAVLMRRGSRGTGREINIIIKGEPRDTVEEALEWMLERTEMAVHDLVVRHGRPDNDGCTVM